MALHTPVPNSRWRASWVWHPDVPLSSPAYVLFRNRFDLPRDVPNIPLRVSADERYVLYLDGRPISRGPSRSDRRRWGYRTVDTGPLAAGPHVLAAVARHLGSLAEVGQMGAAGAFLLAADPPYETLLDTGTDQSRWLCRLDEARQIETVQFYGSTFFAPMRGELIDGRCAAWDFAALECDPAGWVQPRVLLPGEPWCVLDPAGPWWLVPDPLPEMAYRPEAFQRVARVENARPADWDAFVLRHQPLTVPAHTTVTAVLDRGELTNAYPALTVSGGAGSQITLVWCEAPVDPATHRKGNRNDVEGKQIVGPRDRFLPDGGPQRTFETFWFRPFRYVEVTVATAEQPLTLERFDLFFTGYPFERRATFRAEGTDLPLEAIRELGWRTQRLCAHETFFDCPHYEQLQYVGDTRIQAVLVYLETGDDRLVRRAIDDFAGSRLPDGLTASRWPCRLRQVIPPFSLYWIGMLHDFWRYRGDRAFLADYLPVARGVLDWFEARLAGDGLLGPLPYWNFADWVGGWKHGVPPGADDGGSALLSLLFAQALGWAADLHDALDAGAHSQRLRDVRVRIERAVQDRCWDATRNAYADTPTKDGFSVHVQIQAVLNGLLSGDAARDHLLRWTPELGGSGELTRIGTPYWYYYLFEAIRRTGLGDRVLEMMGPWQQMLADGLTTCTEVFGDSRSDCHAWGSTPNIVLVNTVLGIEPAEPGFARVRIKPHLGPLTAASGSIPTPHGKLSVAIRPPEIRVGLPAGVTGELVWHGRSTPLAPGENRVATTN